MTYYTTKSLLGATSFGIPSGPYDGSSLDFHGEPLPAVDYYMGQGSIQTVTINVSNFRGLIQLEASLNNPLTEALWFSADDFGDPEVAASGIFSLNITGNFVWMRARVLDFTGGTINSITLSY